MFKNLKRPMLYYYGAKHDKLILLKGYKSMDIIYHSNYTKVEHPKIIITKDFGKGFYCSMSKEQAEKEANKYINKIVNVYSLEDISDLKIKVFEEYNSEWLDFVVNCRSGNTNDYDIVEGFKTDDTILDIIEEYVNGHIDKEKLLEMMESNWSDRQISFHTLRALNRIKFIRFYNTQEIV